MGELVIREHARIFGKRVLLGRYVQSNDLSAIAEPGLHLIIEFCERLGARGAFGADRERSGAACAETVVLSWFSLNWKNRVVELASKG